MTKVFVMLSKELMDSEYYFSERFTRMQAYIDLCLLAEWKDRKFLKRGQLVELKAGQLAKSEEELAERWQWSRNTVRKYLNEQQSIGNIEQQKSRLITIITVKFGLNVAQQIEQQTLPNTAQQIEQQNEQHTKDIYKSNKEYIKEEDTKVSKKKATDYPQEYEDDFALYGRKGSKKKGYERWKSLSDEDKEKMRSHIPYYLQSNERQYLKDFEGYINQRLFESPVYRGSELLFDPIQMEIPSVYAPKTDGVFQWWDDKEKCLHFNGYIDMVDDGYTSENRPDGAKLKWQMYTWIWSASKKEWIKQ